MMKKILVLALLAAVFGLAWHFQVLDYLSLSVLQEQKADLDEYRAAEPFVAAAIFFIGYVIVTGFSIPGAAIMTLAGGAIFGLWQGVLLVSFASTLGATLAFLLSRTLLRDWVQERFGQQLEAINEGMRKDGALYLFSLRLVPLFPFFVINLLMGLMPITVWRYFIVSQIGMFPATVVYVNAGTQLGQLESASGILSAPLIISFALLGLFPLFAKWVMNSIERSKVYKPYSKPAKFDHNIVAIGAGSAGLVSSYIAAAVRAKVTLIEKHAMGGDCLNTGCVPSKALIKVAKVNHTIAKAAKYGLKTEPAEVDFKQVMQRVQEAITAIEPHDSVERYTDLGVTCISGEASIRSPWEVEVNGEVLTTRNIIIASGGRPRVPAIPGIEDTGYVTSDTVWGLQTLPKRFLVLGGGPIACELAQAFARLGSQVTIAVRGERLLKREDEEVAEFVHQRFIDEGIDVRYQQLPQSFRKTDSGMVADFNEGELAFDSLLVSIGREANVDTIGADHLQLEKNRDGTLKVDDFLRTRFPNIFACGDIIGPYQFTHMAAHQAWFAAVNALFGRFKKFRVDYSVVPWCTFVDPEIGRVGLNELEAKEQGVAYEATTFGIDDLDRAIADDAAYGFIKVLTVPGTDKVLGATIVGQNAGELITEYISAMKHGFGLNKILGTIHIYPTMSEANKYVAGEWKRANAPEKLLQYVEKFHRWERG